jgi:hypothetical protein
MNLEFFFLPPSQVGVSLSLPFCVKEAAAAGVEGSGGFRRLDCTRWWMDCEGEEHHRQVTLLFSCHGSQHQHHTHYTHASFSFFFSSSSPFHFQTTQLTHTRCFYLSRRFQTTPKKIKRRRNFKNKKKTSSMEAISSSRKLRGSLIRLFRFRTQFSFF